MRMVRGGVFAWMVAASMGAPAAAHQEDARLTIRALRQENNRAIAAHDLNAIGAIYSDKAVFVWSDGSSAVGKQAMVETFGEDFADPRWSSVVFTRTPVTIVLGAAGDRAFETGTWIGDKRGQAGKLSYGGSYSAHWIKGAAGWQICGELYVKLR
ncbi:YybH family protein [Sphingomonas immobilis]|uniref:Nuclear transport factor 2 family protein n=1 Tax=Sphingomonas immobilis TaxID=3063997 RepID=A0ABT9A2Q2_9SPHN|nr:nuclear transport factor 2 family protein [Sphingomonas sp. CA1-15]MDO7843007.1 nuclear transport factor 2 family protein [Sphingomonas sp. CA1-15]